MKFRYEAVERIPKQLEPGVVYHSEEFEIAGLLCACGCGHNITLLVPDSHQVASEDGVATIRPSIAVCDAPCRSHYFVTDGQVEWLKAYSSTKAEALMRMQIARHAAEDARPKCWIDRLRDFARQAADVAKSLFAR